MQGENMNALAQLSAATTALAEARTLDDVKRIVDIAEAARTYARAAKLGLEAANYAAEIKLRAERKAGELLAQLERDKGGRPAENSSQPVTSFSQYGAVLNENDINRQTAHRWQTVASIPEDVFEQHLAETKADGDELSTAGLLRVAKELHKSEVIANAAQEAARVMSDDVEYVAPTIYLADAIEFLEGLEDNSFDLLLTDPPYSTDVDDIETFVNEWLPLALAKVKPTGRAYICIGAYPAELLAYLCALQQQRKFTVDAPLIWTYRNTLGVTPRMKYNLNYQVVLHLYSPRSRPLDNSITNEMFSVQDINAPDGRLGDRYHAWQKPDELARRLIKHSTQIGESILDPFACTGTFPLMAARMGRWAEACDNNADNLRIAQGRGCNVELGE